MLDNRLLSLSLSPSLKALIIIIRIVFVVHLALGIHENTTLITASTHATAVISMRITFGRFPKVSCNAKEIRSTKFDTCATTNACVFTQVRSFRTPRILERCRRARRFVAESICPCHMQARVAVSAFYRRPWLFSVRMIKGHTIKRIRCRVYCYRNLHIDRTVEQVVV